MGRRSWMEGLSVTVVEGDVLPEHEFEILKDIIRQVALRVLKQQQADRNSIKSEFDIATSPANS
jgi:hypothetical protein